jgi:hypothetical protein
VTNVTLRLGRGLPTGGAFYNMAMLTLTADTFVGGASAPSTLGAPPGFGGAVAPSGTADGATGSNGTTSTRGVNASAPAAIVCAVAICVLWT